MAEIHESRVIQDLEEKSEFSDSVFLNEEEMMAQAVYLDSLNLQFTEDNNKGQVTEEVPEKIKDDLWAVEDAKGTEDEEKIIPQHSQSLNLPKPNRIIKNMNRSDNFRRLIKRKSSKDKSVDLHQSRNDETDTTMKDSKENMVGLQYNEINDNKLNETLEGKTPSTLLPEDSIDSLDGRSISIEKYLDGDIKIIHHMSLQRTEEEERELERTDDLSEASSVHSEYGINDSITNMDLLRGYLYNLTITCLTTLWGYISTGVQYVYNRYVLGIEIEAGGTNEEGDGQDEADEGQAAVILEKTKKKIFNICNELVTTERAYVKRLGILIQIKARTAAILPAEVIKSMFQNIEVIHQFHHDYLLPQLEKRILEWEEHQKIADIMRKLAPFLKLYTEYVKNFGTANDVFESSKQKSGNFANFVREAENSDEYGRLKVQAHMLEPVQRVPRYELLLKDYLKNLPSQSEDKEDAEEALKLVSDAAKHFEEMMKRDSRIIELMALQSQFEGAVNFVSADRELVLKGKMKYINTKAGKISERVLHLFTDMLLISSEERYLLPGMADKFRVRHTFSLDNTKVVYGTNLEIPFTFYVKAPDQMVELSASSQKERKQWLDEIQKQINTFTGNNNQSDDVTYDSYNETSISEGFMLQRYTFQLSSDGKNWKKRSFALYDNGLIGVTRGPHDKQTMASVHVCNFQAGVAFSQQKKGKVLVLVGENKTYQLYDENSHFVQSWHKAIKDLSSKYHSEEDHSIEDWTAIVDTKNRLSTLSNLSGDSGIDTMSLSSQASNASNQFT